MSDPGVGGQGGCQINPGSIERKIRFVGSSRKIGLGGLRGPNGLRGVTKEPGGLPRNPGGYGVHTHPTPSTGDPMDKTPRLDLLLFSAKVRATMVECTFPRLSRRAYENGVTP